MTAFDVVVIGNGILGLSTVCAILQQDKNVRIALVGPSDRRLGASPAAGFMQGCFGEVTQTARASSYGRKKIEMAYQAKKLWPQWIESINDAVAANEQFSARPGTIVINNTRGGTLDDDNFDAVVETAQEYDEPFETIAPRDIPSLSPSPPARPLRAMFLPGEGSVDSAQLMYSLTAFANASGRVVFHDTVATSLKVSGNRVQGVSTGDGAEISGKQIVLAAGISSQALLDQLPEVSLRIPRLFACGGISVVIDPEPAFFVGGAEPAAINPHVVRTPNRAFACGLHQVPRDDGKAYIGATNWATMKPFSKPNVSDLYFLLECAMDQLHQDYVWAQVDSWSAGNRPVTVDTYPLLGETSSIEGLWLLTGTFRDGAHMSPLLAKDIADRLLGGRGVFDNIFEPERRPINAWTVESAMGHIAQNVDAAVWEHQVVSATKFGFHAIVPPWMLRSLGDLYEEIGSEYVLPPELAPLVEVSRERMIPYFREYYQSVEKAWR